MGAMTYMISTAVAGYFMFFTIFVEKTYDLYIYIFPGDDRRNEKSSKLYDGCISMIYIMYAKSYTNSRNRTWS